MAVVDVVHWMMLVFGLQSVAVFGHSQYSADADDHGHHSASNVWTTKSRSRDVVSHIQGGPKK